MAYQVPHSIEHNKVFLVNFSNLKGRLDPLFYNEHFDFTDFCKLSSIAKISGGKRIPLGQDYSSIPTPFFYLRVADIQDDGSVNFNHLKFIDENTFNVLKRYEISNGDLAISIAGTIGKVVMVKDIPQNAHVILTENCAKIIIGNSEVLPQYLQLVLMLPILQKQIELNYIQTTIPKLGLDRVGNLMLPNIPSVNIQQEIIDYYNSQLEQKRKNDNLSAKILASIDHYLLKVLGIQIAETKALPLSDRIFSVNFCNIVGDRLDPKRVLYLGEHTRISLFDNVLLKQIAQIEKGTAITSDEVNKAGQYPVIAGGQTSPYNHDKYNYEGNVITVSASGAYAGYVWYHSGPIFASDCSVIYSKSDNFLTEYIFEVLRVQQAQLYLLQQGAGQPHVYPDDLGKLWVPVLSLDKQKKLVDDITSIRQKAETLKMEGNAILEEAKKEVETMIMKYSVTRRTI